MHVVRPVALLTLSFPDRHGTLAPCAPRHCPCDRAGRGVRHPAAAATTKAENIAPRAVNEGLVREVIVTAAGDGTTDSEKGIAFGTAEVARAVVCRLHRNGRLRHDQSREVAISKHRCSTLPCSHPCRQARAVSRSPWSVPDH